MVAEISGLFAAHPLASTTYLFLAVASFATILFCLWRGKLRIAYWSVVALILVGLVFSVGDDHVHHVVRILGLRDQLWHGRLSAMLGDSVEGTAYPVFLYYSVVPYILPVALTLVGISGPVALKLAMALQLAVFAAGVEALVRRGSAAPGVDYRYRYLAAVLLISATYVFGLWLTRAAFGELWAISLVPWVVHFGLKERSFLPLMAILFLQLCAHPLVFAHCLIAELVVLFGLSERDWMRAIGRMILPGAVALVLSAPFWLPQFLWLDAIKGDAALPVQFPQTFLLPSDLVDPTFRFGIPVLLAALVLSIVSTRERLPWRAVVMVLVFAVLVLIQTTAMRPITIHLPVINLSQFVWRLMFPAAFVAFGVLLASERETAPWLRRGFGLLSALSVALLVFNLATSALKVIPYHSAASFSADSYADESGLHLYYSPDNVYGIGLFEPNYGALRQRCSVADGAASQIVSYAHLQQGVVAEAEYLVVRHAPIGFVRYHANGTRMGEGGCRDSLVVGPVPHGATIKVSEGWLDALMAVRVLVLALAALVFAVIASGAGRKIWHRAAP